MARSASSPAVPSGTQGDTAWHSPGDLVIFAGPGNGSLDVGDGASLVDGGDGDDAIYCNNGTQVLIGGDGDDLISGESGPQLLAGGDGNDSIFTGPGNQTVLGGAGNDRRVSRRTWGITSSPADAPSSISSCRRTKIIEVLRFTVPIQSGKAKLSIRRQQVCIAFQRTKHGGVSNTERHVLRLFHGKD